VRLLGGAVLAAMKNVRLLFPDDPDKNRSAASGAADFGDLSHFGSRLVHALVQSG